MHVLDTEYMVKKSVYVLNALGLYLFALLQIFLNQVLFLLIS